jgi:hypothetical protein
MVYAIRLISQLIAEGFSRKAQVRGVTIQHKSLPWVFRICRENLSPLAGCGKTRSKRRFLVKSRTPVCRVAAAYFGLGSGEWTNPSTRPTFHDPSGC